MRKAVVVVCVLYAVGVAAALILLLNFVDESWPATLLAFGPRWPILLPAAVFLPLALAFKRWGAAGIVAVAALLSAGPYMGLVLPFPRSQAAGQAQPKTIRVATFNIQGREIADPWVEERLQALDADVVVMAECAGLHHKGDLFGYHTVTIHGMCLFSKLKVLASDSRPPNDAWVRYGAGVVLHAKLEVDGQPFHLVGLHLATVRRGLEALRARHIGGMKENIELRRWESEVARAYAEDKVDGPLVVVGDLNMPVESRIYRRYWGDLTNAFDECGFGYGYTKHTRLFGVRIDHVLTDDRWRCHGVEVGDGRGSDHDPVIAELELLDG
jgi:endonuclease/exonuclease/phosphatase (EEP) superfamily protein YafD